MCQDYVIPWVTPSGADVDALSVVDCGEVIWHGDQINLVSPPDLVCSRKEVSELATVETYTSPMRTLVLLVAVTMFVTLMVYFIFAHEAIHIGRSGASTFSKPEFNLTEPGGAQKRKMLLSFFLSGELRRQEIIRLNLVHLTTSLRTWHVDCLVMYFAPYASAPPWLKTQPPEFGCQVIFGFHLPLVTLMKFMNPLLMSGNGYELITICCDDVVVHPPESNLDPSTYFDLVLQKQLSVATPSIVGSNWGCLRPHGLGENSVGRLVDMIELQMTTFTAEAWACFYELADSEYPSGWGMDIWFYDYCISAKRIRETRMGVLDLFSTIHARLPHVGEVQDLVSLGAIMEAQSHAWFAFRNITLTTRTSSDHCSEPICRVCT